MLANIEKESIRESQIIRFSFYRARNRLQHAVEKINQRLFYILKILSIKSPRA